VKKQQERPVVITDAARSQREQLRSREIRYVSMMGLRAACLITGAILISVKPPLLPVWLILCAAGMVLLPWMAVLIANDRPAKTRAERAQAARPAPSHRVLEEKPADEHRVIDAED
jgi:arginine exporter protein ArgO